MIEWEKLEHKGTDRYLLILRTKVPGGWFVLMCVTDGGGPIFYPDPDHKWDGNSLP